jgi:hypothetical protein
MPMDTSLTGDAVPGRMRYDWERFWIDAEQRVEIDPADFFPDPRDEQVWFGPALEPRCLDELHDEPCLILLGEPGLGKSQAIKDAVASGPAGALVERINLAAYPEAGALRSKLVEGDRWHEWAVEGRSLHLYLDSLDEAMLSFPAIHEFLLEELADAGGSFEALFLRIACRSADWISEFAEGLRGLWPAAEVSSDPVRALSLVPLRERDVRAAALAEGLDGMQLLGEIDERDARGLAALPLTLRMMLAAAKEGGGLPRTQAELFESGVLDLLRGPDRPKREALRMEIGERLAVAQRIGAATLLSRRSGISLLPGRAGPGEVDPAEIAGYDEADRLAAGGDRFGVGEKEVLATLRTALFSLTERERVDFSHRNLAEYCAGAYLAEAGLDRAGITELLFASGDGDGGLVPQLREVAAWAAALDPTVLEVLLDAEAEVLLRIDRLALDEAQRARTVEAILGEDSAERIERWDRRIWSGLESLDHPDLPDQIIPVIEDRDASWPVRRLAITLTHVCGREECEPALLDLAFDEDQPASARAEAVWALRGYGSLASRKALTPLALEPIEDDVDDAIKGAALAAVFPDVLTAEQVFAVVAEPRNMRLVGIYLIFLHEDLPEALQRSDLPVALKWAASLEPSPEWTGALDLLADAVLAVAWPYVAEDDEIAALVGEVVRVRLEAEVELLDSTFGKEDLETFRGAAARHRLVEALIPALGKSQLYAFQLAEASPELLIPSDLTWALAGVERSLGTEAESAWAEIAQAVFELPISDSDLEALFRLCGESRELERRLGGWLSPVAIDSPEASFRYLYGLSDAESPGQEEEGPDEKAVEAALLAAERGEEEGWWRVTSALLEYAGAESEIDLTAGLGWGRSSPDLQRRIVAAARAALDRDPPPAEQWFGHPVHDRSALAGYQALHLIAKVDRALFEALTPQIWERWMPAVIDRAGDWLKGEDRQGQAILARAATLAAPAFMDWVGRKLSTELESDGRISFLHRLREIAPRELDDLVFPWLTDESVSEATLRELCGFALRRDPERAYGLVKPRLAGYLGDAATDEDRASVVTIASELLGVVPGLAWPEIAVLFDRCPEVGESVAMSLGHVKRSSVAREMSDRQLAELVSWIFRTSPESADPPKSPGFSQRNGLRQYRQWMLETLADRGSNLAVETIEGLHDRHGTPNLREAVGRAKDARRAVSPAPAPADVVRMLRAGRPLPPRSAGDLVAKIVAALESIQRELQASQPPTAAELWNTRPVNTPKDEGYLSNWLAARLRHELGESFDISRERLTSGGEKGRGETVDLQVVCLEGGDRGGKLQVLIEVKGSWEPAIKGKVRTQLGEDYMAKTGIDHGLFLVFWFDRKDWDMSDSRRRRSTFKSAEATRAALAPLAAEAAADLGVQLEVVVLDGSLP